MRAAFGLDGDRGHKSGPSLRQQGRAPCRAPTATWIADCVPVVAGSSASQVRAVCAGPAFRPATRRTIAELPAAWRLPAATGSLAATPYAATSSIATGTIGLTHTGSITNGDIAVAIERPAAFGYTETVSATVTRIPQNTVELDADVARKVLALIDALDDHDDVQGVSANFDVSDEIMAEIQ